MSRKQKKRRKRILQIVISSILFTFILVMSVLFIYPRTILYIKVQEKIKEMGDAQKFTLVEGYAAQRDWMHNDWLSVEIPYEYGIIEETEKSEDESGAYFSGSGINVFVSRPGKPLNKNEKIAEEDRPDYNGAYTLNQYENYMYNSVYELPTVLQLIPIDDIKAQFDEYFEFHDFFDNQRYSYYVRDGYGYTILNTEDEGVNLYSINVYDLQTFDKVGHMTLSYDIGASRNLAVEDMGVKLLIDSIAYYDE